MYTKMYTYANLAIRIQFCSTLIKFNILITIGRSFFMFFAEWFSIPLKNSYKNILYLFNESSILAI